MKRTVVILAALLAVAGGCKKRKVRRDREVDVARRGEEAIFVIGRPRVEAADIPGRFAAPLPSAVDEIDQAPPSPFVWNALAADKFGIRQKLLAAVAMAAHGGAIDEDLRSYFVNNLQAAGPRLCDWIAAQTAAAPEATRTIFWEALSRCTGPATIAALARDDVPSATLIDYYFESSGVRVPFQPRVAKAAAELAGTREEYELRKIGFAYAAMDGPEVVPSMLALQRTIPDRKRRALVALGLLHHPDPAAKALGAASCRDPDVAGDSMCGGDDGDEEPEDAPADLASAVTDWDFDPKLVLSQFRRDDVIAALQACATSTEDDESLPALCLTRLAGLDRAKAVTAARARPRDPDQPALDAVIAALLAFPDQGALERELAGLGFTPRPGTPPPASPPISVEEVLEAGGYVHRFDTETGTWPNQHDDLLAQLAALAAPALDDVLFEEVPQGDSDGEDPYTLGAYADGNRYRLEAKNLGDWYDVEAVLGLLNAVLVARKSDVRFTILPTGDQTASVLAGKRAAILTLVQRKLIAIAAPGEAEATGKDFEDRVMQQLQREGKLP